jgi:hypothetical protein
MHLLNDVSQLHHTSLRIQINQVTTRNPISLTPISSLCSHGCRGLLSFPQLSCMHSGCTPTRATSLTYHILLDIAIPVIKQEGPHYAPISPAPHPTLGQILLSVPSSQEAELVRILCYKPEGRGFETDDVIRFSGSHSPGVYSIANRNVLRPFLRVKGDRRVRLIISPQSVSRFAGTGMNVDASQTYRPVTVMDCLHFTVFSNTFSLTPSYSYYKQSNEKNCVFWNVTPCGSCKNRRFG